MLLFLSFSLYGHKKHILVIESYHADYSWDISYKRGLEKAIGGEYEIFYFEMNTKRLAKSEFKKMANLAWKRYKKLKPSLVVLGDDNALKCLGGRFAKTNTPVVYLGINNNPRAYDMIRHKNITGVLERPLLKRSIIYIKDLIKVKKILILFDSGTTSTTFKKGIFKNKNSMFLNGVNIDIKFIDNYNNWKRNIIESKKNGYDAVIIGLYHTIKDDDNKHINSEEVLEWTSENTPLPPFSFWDFSVGKNKTIGGYVLFGEEQGIVAGKMVLDILSGKSPRTIEPKTAEKGKFLFSKYQLKKWKIKLTDNIKAKTFYSK